jgi:pimeloyl-ACP methyl ester carboxylesterase
MPTARNSQVEIHYETFGDPANPTLLLVNGLGSQCINYAAEWCAMFAAEGLQVVRFDNRDMGLSSHLPGVAYTLGDMAADAIAVLDALGVERAHVMGLSMGGMIVQTMAVEHPHRLLTMTSVMSHTGEPEYGGSSPRAFELLTAPPATNREEYVANAIAGLREWGSPEFADEARCRANAEAAFDRCFDPAGTGRQFMAIRNSAPRADALTKVTVPTLVVHGDRDTLIDQSGGRRTAELIPGARFALIEGMGHDYPPQLWRRWVDLVFGHVSSHPA